MGLCFAFLETWRTKTHDIYFRHIPEMPILIIKWKINFKNKIEAFLPGKSFFTFDVLVQQWREREREDKGALSNKDNEWELYG